MPSFPRSRGYRVGFLVTLVSAPLLSMPSLAFASGPASRPVLASSVVIGGSGTETIGAVAVDDAGYVYVAGGTASTDFPVTAHAVQTARRGPSDAFVVKLTQDLKTVVYATYLGGTGTEWVTGLSVDGAGNAYVGVVSTSTDYPAASLRDCSSGCGYITRLRSDGQSIDYSRQATVAPVILGAVAATTNGSVYFRTLLVEGICFSQKLATFADDTTVRTLVARGGCEVIRRIEAVAPDPAHGVLAAYTDPVGYGRLYVRRFSESGTSEWMASRSFATVDTVTSDGAGGAYVLGSHLLHVNADGVIDSAVPSQVPPDWTSYSDFYLPSRLDTFGRLHAVLCSTDGTLCRTATLDTSGAVTGSTVIAGGTTAWQYGYGPLGQLFAAGNAGGDVTVALYGDAVLTDFSGPVTLRFDTGATWSAATIRPDAEYEFIRQDPAGVWRVVRDWSSVATYTWFPTYTDRGVHHLQVWVRTPGSSALYEDWRGTEILVTDQPLPVVSDLVPSVSSYHVGETITWTAHATGGVGVPQFAFLRLDSDGWHVAQAYSSRNSYTWIPGPADLGPHTLQVWVRNGDSGAAYEDWTGTGVSVDPPVSLAVRLVALNPIPTADTRAITWRALTTGGTGPLQYQFWRLNPDGTWSLGQDYSARDTYGWAPGVHDAGDYVVQVWVRNAGSTALYDAWASTGAFTIDPPGPLTVSLLSQPTSPLSVGLGAWWTATIASATMTEVEYQYVRLDADGWHIVSSYSQNRETYAWWPATADIGSHEMQVWVRRVGSTAPFDGWASVPSFEVQAAPAETPSPSVGIEQLGPVPIAGMGGSVGWIATATGGGSSSSTPYIYKFIRLDADGWHVVQDYGASNTYIWSPADGDAGEHLIQVWVRNTGSTALYDGWASTGTFIVPDGR